MVGRDPGWAGHVTTQNLGGKNLLEGWGNRVFLFFTVKNLLRHRESGMSLDSVVFAQKSCFKTKHQKRFFTLLTQVYVGFVPTWLHVFPLFP